MQKISFVKKCNIFRQILNTYLGKINIKRKISFFFQFLALPKDQQSFSTYHTMYIILAEIVFSSDVKHCLISIFELKMMAKIGVIFMSFSNPTCPKYSESA